MSIVESAVGSDDIARIADEVVQNGLEPGIDYDLRIAAELLGVVRRPRCARSGQIRELPPELVESGFGEFLCIEDERLERQWGRYARPVGIPPPR